MLDIALEFVNNDNTSLSSTAHTITSPWQNYI